VCPTMLAILITSCRDTYAGGNGDSEILMLDIAAGQAILKAELGYPLASKDIEAIEAASSVT
jgi:hypothetical protein